MTAVEGFSKKVWIRPELIVLARNKPEEVVLGTCKNDENPVSPDSSAGGCQIFSQQSQSCFSCEGWGYS